ncbi:MULTISPECIES: rhomboid-like protein [unclassified Streptomyces]|uniref:rhomboid-like protein n=1 Tax=unclassified Streptomyces TaxID=2593676 RepID=UPI00336AC8B9
MTETRAAGTAAGEPRRAARPAKRCRAAARRAATASHSGPSAPDAATPQLSPRPRAHVSPAKAPPGCTGLAAGPAAGPAGSVEDAGGADSVARAVRVAPGAAVADGGGPASTAVREGRAVRALPASRPAAGARLGWAGRAVRAARVVSGPGRAPFTVGYALVLVVTGLFARLADPDLVHDVLTHSSTDVVNLADRPVLVLVASAGWVAGGVLTPYLLAFLVVVGALERRLGGLRTAGVFLLGHVLATLMTELPVAAAVAVGHLPDSSLRRLDYGISYGLLACTGALAGLLGPRLRWTLLGGITLVLVLDLVEFADPLTDWGHLLALAIGVLCRPYVRRVAQRREPVPSGRAPRSA